MPRILFVAAHRPDRSPSQRYRFEQFAAYWERQGFTHTYAWLIDAADDAAFYAPGNMLAKGRIFLKGWLRRARQVELAREHDLIFLQREAFMTGSTRFERRLKESGKPLIYDFDDAIWHLDVSEANRRLRWLKNPGKTADLIAMADRVIAGNAYLADYAHHHNEQVQVIPTVIDTDRYRPSGDLRREGHLTIGWTGSHTSQTYLEAALPMLRRLHREHGDRLRFKVISDRPFRPEGLPVEHVRWNSATEPEDLSDIDIGIMPMPDTEWTRGKCGFKGLQFMALGKAVVLQRAGANMDIVDHGANGLLAGTEEEWLEALGRLVRDADLRARLGREARRTVEERYSVTAWRDRYLDLFNELIETKR